MGGLFTGLALHDIGFDVKVFERSSGELRHRGAGIVAQPRMLRFIEDRGIADPEGITTSTHRRRYLASDGTVSREYRNEMTFTSWDGVYRRLRDAFPDDRYHAGREVTDVERTDGTVEVRTADGSKATGDLLVAAEGPRSITREQFLPKTSPEYAGYVAWRGVTNERDLPAELVEGFEDTFTFYQGDEQLVLGYLIPGPDGETARDRRRLNWVWYDHVPDDDVTEVLTDAHGRRRELSVPPGLLSESVEKRLYADAEGLAPLFTRLVRATDDPFVQPIVDLTVPQMAFGRVCLLGDAAFVARPHTAMGTEKAATDAIELAEALADYGPIESPLEDWERRRLPAGERLVEKGRRMGLERLE